MKHAFASRKKNFFPKLLTPILGSQNAATFWVTLAISLISYEGSKIATLFSGSFLGPDFGVKKCDILALIFRFFLFTRHESGIKRGTPEASFTEELFWPAF